MSVWLFESAVTATLSSAVAEPPEMYDSTVLSIRLIAAEPAMPATPPPEPPAAMVEMVDADSEASFTLPRDEVSVEFVLEARMVLAMSL